MLNIRHYVFNGIGTLYFSFVSQSCKYVSSEFTHSENYIAYKLYFIYLLILLMI